MVTLYLLPLQGFFSAKEATIKSYPVSCLLGVPNRALRAKQVDWPGMAEQLSPYQLVSTEPIPSAKGKLRGNRL